jgi:hypothetical protein
MVDMMMGEKNCPNLAYLNTRFCKTACNTVTRVDKIHRAVDNQQIGRVCLARSREWTTERPQRDKASAGLSAALFARMQSATPSAAQQRSQPDAEIVGGEVSFS